MASTRATYYIVSAVIRQGDHLLLVEQHAKGRSATKWALPGGVAEPGEALFDALAREVREETGLRVTDPGRLAYMIQTDDPVGGDSTLVFGFDVARWEGHPHAEDPDGLVTTSRFFPLDQALSLLRGLPSRAWYEPVTAYLRGAAGATTLWVYQPQPNDEPLLIGRLPAGGVAADEV